MTPTPRELEPTDDESPRRLSRRTMIKRAAAAGAVAWTAPVIIDSLASPAAAATGSFCIAVTPSSCTATTTADYGSVFTGTDCTTDPCSGSQVVAGTALSDYCIAASTCVPNLSVTFTIGAGCACTFIAGTGAVPKPGTDCVAGTLGGAGKSIAFGIPASATGGWAGFRLAVTCV